MYFLLTALTDANYAYVLNIGLSVGWSLTPIEGEWALSLDGSAEADPEEVHRSFDEKIFECESALSLMQGAPKIMGSDLPRNIWWESGGVKRAVRLPPRILVGEILEISDSCSGFCIKKGWSPEETKRAMLWEHAEAPIHRMLARNQSDLYRQVLDDWEKQGTPSVRALVVYVETMFFEVPESEFEDGGSLANLKSDLEVFNAMANSPEHYGLEARHGRGSRRAMKKGSESMAGKTPKPMKKHDRKSKKWMLDFAKSLMKVWESRLVHRAMGERLLLSLDKLIKVRSNEA